MGEAEAAPDGTPAAGDIAVAVFFSFLAGLDFGGDGLGEVVLDFRVGGLGQDNALLAQEGVDGRVFGEVGAGGVAVDAVFFTDPAEGAVAQVLGSGFDASGAKLRDEGFVGAWDGDADVAGFVLKGGFGLGGSGGAANQGKPKEEQEGGLGHGWGELGMGTAGVG